MSAIGKKTSTSSHVSSENLNNATYVDYYKRLRLLALSMFEWVNLPPSVNERFLERSLYNYGKAIFVYDDKLGYLGLKVIGSGELNIYEEPIRYTAYSINYTKEFANDDCVLIRNNYEEIPTDSTIQLFANRLFEVERTLDVNIKSQKTPVLIKCSDKEKMTLKNLYMQYSGNEPFIFGYKNINDEAFKVLKTDAPFISDKLMLYKHDVWCEAMTFLGIENANTDKKERLIVDEVNANNGQINLSAETMLLTRKQACKFINEKYGLNIDVKLRTYNENEEGDELIE